MNPKLAPRPRSGSEARWRMHLAAAGCVRFRWLRRGNGWWPAACGGRISAMFYAVSARPIASALGELYRKLTDGTIRGQQPDGREIVESMQRARMTESGEVRWSEQCFCATPLNHERQTVYDHYFTDLRTEVVEDYVEFDGEPFMEFLARQAAS